MKTCTISDCRSLEPTWLYLWYTAVISRNRFLTQPLLLKRKKTTIENSLKRVKEKPLSKFKRKEKNLLTNWTSSNRKMPTKLSSNLFKKSLLSLTKERNRNRLRYLSLNLLTYQPKSANMLSALIIWDPISKFLRLRETS